MSDIHPTSVVEDGAVLGEGVQIGPFCTVGPNVKIGDRTRLISHAALDGRTEVGADCIVHPFVHLGGPPQHLAHKGEPTLLVIGDRNLFREQVTVHAGTVLGGGVTRVGSDGTFLVGAHVAHDCIVGDHVVMTNHATLGGHVVVGDWANLGGICGVHQFARIGRYSFIGAGAIVTKDVIPYGSVWGNHAHLEGLNLVGLKRRGFSREAINHLRAAYRLLFAPEGTFQERLDDVEEAYGDWQEVSEIIAFIRADANRPICLPSLD